MHWVDENELWKEMPINYCQINDAAIEYFFCHTVFSVFIQNLKVILLQAERTRRKVTRMVVALVITFFICWLPFYIWHLIQIRGVKAKIGVCHNVRDFTFCLGYANRYVDYD